MAAPCDITTPPSWTYKFNLEHYRSGRPVVSYNTDAKEWQEVVLFGIPLQDNVDIFIVKWPDDTLGTKHAHQLRMEREFWGAVFESKERREKALAAMRVGGFTGEFQVKQLKDDQAL